MRDPRLGQGTLPRMQGDAVTAPVVVSGFGRCGYTMLMTMLAAGGLPPADGASPGSFEHSTQDALSAVTPGRAVKILNPLAVGATPDPSWHVLWLDRDPRWQAESARKFIAWVTGQRMTVRETRAYRESLIRDRDHVTGWLAAQGCPLLTLSYEAVLAAPTAAAEQVAAFLPWAALDIPSMAAVVHARGGRTLPDMAVEERLGRLVEVSA